MLKAARIVYRHRHVIAQGLQPTQMLTRESIEIVMRRGEYPDQPAVYYQGNCHLGARGGFARNVIRVLAYVGA